MNMVKQFILSIALGITGLSAPEVEVIAGNDDAYQISGRYLLTQDAIGAPTVAKKAATCIGCKWHLQRICPDENVANHLGYDCTKPASYSCASGSRYQIWFLDEGLWRPGDWQLRGSSCIGPRGPTAITQLHQEVTDSAVGFLPELIVKLQPKTNSLVNLPTKVKVKSANQFKFNVEVAGIPVEVTATASYRYEFRDGHQVTTSAREINHVYRNRGEYPIKVTAIWLATWSTALHGTNPVAGNDLTQSKTIATSVLAARGRLIKR